MDSLSLNPGRLLVVDDERDFVKVLARRLQHQGYKVDAVQTGIEALGYLSGNEVDVVLLDIKMPGIDGLETLRRFKARWPLVEVIMITAHATVATGVNAIRMGAWDYVIKPFDRRELITRIEAAVRHKRDRERRIIDVKMQPYMTEGEKEALIAAILAEAPERSGLE